MWEDIKKNMMNKMVGNIRGYFDIHKRLKEENIFVFSNEEGYQDFKGNGWTLIMHIPTAKAFASAIELRNRIIAVSLPIIIFSVFIVFFCQLCCEANNTTEGCSSRGWQRESWDSSENKIQR
jgi:hypothetical protein